MIRSSAPLAGLRRVVSSRPPPIQGERCEMCAEPIGAEHQHVVNLESRGLMCTCRGCYLLFTAEDAELRYRAVPDRYLSFPDFTVGCPRLGRAGDPGRPGVPVPQLGAGPDGRVLPRPGRGDRVRAAAGGLGRGSSRQPAARAAAARRRGAADARPDREPDAGCRPATWCRSTPATSWSAGSGRCGAASTAAARRGRPIDEFFAAVAERSRPRRGGRPMTDLRVHRRSTSSPSRTPPPRS